MLFEHFLRTYIPLREHHLSLDKSPSRSALLEGSKIGGGLSKRREANKAVHLTVSILCIDYGHSLKISDLIRRCQLLKSPSPHHLQKCTRNRGPFAPPALAAPADALDLAVDDRVFLVEKLLSG